MRIDRNSWVRNSCVVIADIGENCIVGAGSVLVKPIPARSVAVGNPAQVVRTRESGTLSEPFLNGPLG